MKGLSLTVRAKLWAQEAKPVRLHTYLLTGETCSGDSVLLEVIARYMGDTRNLAQVPAALVSKLVTESIFVKVYSETSAIPRDLCVCPTTNLEHICYKAGPNVLYS